MEAPQFVIIKLPPQGVDFLSGILEKAIVTGVGEANNLVMLNGVVTRSIQEYQTAIKAAQETPEEDQDATPNKA